MVSHMKTTVELPNELMREAQEVARQERTTLKELMETGLRCVLSQRSSGEAFVLEDASVGGNGVQPEFRGAGWDKVRDALYEQP